jgi:hypothetical protein
MVGTTHSRLWLGAFLLACAAGCEPLVVSTDHFWGPRPDSGSGLGLGGGAGTGIDLGAGSGGNDGTQGGGSGGTSGLGGMTGSGGRSTDGGATGTGGFATGTGGVTGAGGATIVAPGSLTVAVTTRSAGGRYEPDNVGAIWIADSGNKFVKSLFVWGSQRRRELSAWNSATAAAGLANNLVDAVTAATMSGHGVRMGAWNGTDARRALVPDGSYKVCFELRDGGGQSQCVDFMKTRSPQTVTPADTTTFTKRTIGFTP